MLQRLRGLPCTAVDQMPGVLDLSQLCPLFATCCLKVLRQRLPCAPPADQACAAYDAWRSGLQQALVSTMVDLHHSFACKGVLGGSTASVLIQVGRLHLAQLHGS